MTPEEWNRVCISIDGIDGTFDIDFNALKVKNQRSSFLKRNTELIGSLTIGSSKDSTFYGQITDLNILSAFSKENIIEYQKCGNLTDPEYIFKWNENDWKNKSTFFLESEDLCKPKKTVYDYEFKTKRSFEKGFKLCDRIGGIPYEEWNENKTINSEGLQNACPWFWLPVRFNQNKLLSESNPQEIISESQFNWSFGSPYDVENRPCLYMDHSLHTVSNSRCDGESCHICKLITPIKFKLDGLCENSIIDTEFSLEYDDDGTQDLNWNGFGGSAIKMNLTSRQWEIVDMLNLGVVLGRTLLEAPEPENYPLGEKAWEILNDTCVGPNQRLVLLLKFSHCTKVYYLFVFKRSKSSN